MMLLIFLLISCETMIIVINDYDRIELTTDMSDLDKFKNILKQINIMKTHINDLEDQIIMADGYRITVIKQ